MFDACLNGNDIFFGHLVGVEGAADQAMAVILV